MTEVQQLTGASPEELVQLVALSHELHEDGRTPTASEVEQMIRDPNTLLMVALDGERIVAMATLYIVQKLGSRTSYLEDVVVLSEYRGEGIGKKLMETVIALARERQVRSISLTSRPERVAAHRLYDSVGFAKRDTSTFKLSLS